MTKELPTHPKIEEADASIVSLHFSAEGFAVIANWATFLASILPQPLLHLLSPFLLSIYSASKI